MQRPHESVFERNPAFADLWPRLDKRIRQLLDEPDHAATKQHLLDQTREWTKLKIMWDELNLVLADPRYKELSDSLSHYIAKAQFPEQFAQDLKEMNVPATHTFIVPPSNLDERLAILSDILASTLDEKLLVFKQLQAATGGDEDLIVEKQYRDAQRAEYRSAIEALHRQINQNLAVVYDTATTTIIHQTDYLQKVKHGSVERFVNSYLIYHDAASSALLEKAKRTENGLIAEIYTPEKRAALEKEAREIKRLKPQVEADLKRVKEEVARHKERSTPEYVAAIAEYKRLQDAINQAERDIDKLLHYKTPG